jgi:hypothetical protein
VLHENGGRAFTIVLVPVLVRGLVRGFAGGFAGGVADMTTL